jgi:hypothetical protein
MANLLLIVSLAPPDTTAKTMDLLTQVTNAVRVTTVSKELS